MRTIRSASTRNPKQAEFRRTVDETRSARATQAVGAAIQDLAAARLGRAVLPVAAALLAAVLTWAFRGGSTAVWVTAGGAPVTVAAMLAYGVRITKRAFGSGHVWWMPWAALGGFVPTLYGFYTFGWVGVRGLVRGPDPGRWMAVVFMVLGWWCIRSWMKVVELERLSRVMRTALPEEEMH